ncbi:MAG TPA: hypothetical protein VGI42_04040, partial [Chthoniobacterales bacterium]
MKSLTEEYETALIKRVLRVVLTGVFAVLLIVGARKGYERWTEHRLLKLGFELFQAGRYDEAERVTLDAFRIDRQNLTVAWLLANIAEKQGKPYAIERWGRLAAMRPGGLEESLGWARTALAFGDLAVADKALEAVPESGRDAVAYHELAGELAFKRKDLAAAGKHFSEAARLAPGNDLYRLKLATVEVQSADSTMRTRGRKVLGGFEEDPRFRREAVESLLDEALKDQDWAAALAFGEKLQSFPEATLSDRLTYLDTLHHAKDSRFTEYLARVQAEIHTSGDDVAKLVSWMSANGLAAEALAWIQNLPPAITAETSVRLALADAYIALRDWNSLQQLVQNPGWDEYESVRQMYLARAWREQKDDLRFAAAWVQTLRGDGTTAATLARMAETLLKWGWEREAVEVYLRVAEDRGYREWALQTLYKHFAETGDTAGLYSIALRLAREKPDDASAQNNAAQLSLLLEMNTAQGQKTARELYSKEPKNPAFASTYAFALYLNRDFPKALSVMNSLSEEQLREPSVAAYYGMVL